MKSHIWLSLLLLLPLVSSYNINSDRNHRRNPGTTNQFSDSAEVVKPTPPLIQQRTSLNKQLRSIYEAYNVEYVFPSKKERKAAIANGRFNPDVAFPVDVDVYYPPGSDVPDLFMTIPRFGDGVPYSLGKLTPIQKPNGTIIEAFPSYAMHSSYGANCDGLTSVFRTQIDQCGRMWIIDSGEIARTHYCQPQVVVLDLKTQVIVSRYRLPENVFTRNTSRIVNILVDIADPPPTGQCYRAFVYLADPTANSLIVYDVVNQKSWLVDNMYTHPDPNFSTHTIAGESFQLEDGAFGMAVTPRNLGLRRMLYFHPLSHDVQAAVPLDVINNPKNFDQDAKSSLDQFINLGRRGIHCGTPAMTPQGYLMCGFFDPVALVGWDIRTPYTSENRIVMAENKETLQFIGGLKVILNPQGKYDVWMLTNRAQKFFSGSVNYSEINYRILECGLDELLKGQPCVH